MRFLIVAILATACHERTPPTPPVVAAAPVDAAPAPDAAPAVPKNIDSAEILAREPVTTGVEIKHVLIAWKELEPAYHGQLDPRAAQRTNEQAAALAREIAATLAKDVSQIDALMREHSEDPGSKNGVPYTVSPDAPFVPEFKALALRLHDNEVGIVRTQFGYHVVLRLPPDPLISADILARAPTDEKVYVQHIMIGWDSTRSHPARTKAEADTLATATLARVKKGEPMPKLMAEVSEDPGSKDNGKVYEISSSMEPAFKNLSMRLKLGEAGLVKTPYGWHIVKRVAAPPPDALESAAIMKRKPVTESAKVKHILLGWDAVHAKDERGEKRTRAELEKLVKATLARLKKGERFETVMDELSEDPGSAKDGRSYDITPTGAFVAPFLQMSLRLNVGEIGVVKTDFGIHIIKRVE